MKYSGESIPGKRSSDDGVGPVRTVKTGPTPLSGIITSVISHVLSLSISSLFRGNKFLEDPERYRISYFGFQE